MKNSYFKRFTWSTIIGITILSFSCKGGNNKDCTDIRI
jgi:hypothetical protein